VNNAVEPLTLPVRGAFYYPWFPETWTVAGQPVHYQPTLGLYDSSSAPVVDNHINALDHAKIDIGIASWWGPGTHAEAVRIPLLLDRTAALGSPLRWAVYYEQEGSADPTVAQIQSDLQYLMSNYAGRPEYARVAGKPVVLVYSANDVSCDVADRWKLASEGRWYVSLKAFSGYQTCVNQPDAWHQYAGSTPSDRQLGHSYTISPGFWKADEVAPRLARDLDRWRQNVRDMVASNEPWQLVVSFNEWGEGTAVESAAEWGSSYLDALADDGVAPPPPPPPTVTFAAAGDHGANPRADASLAALDASGADFYLALGDLDYDETISDAAWCDYVTSRLPTLGPAFPFALLAGNHEEQGGQNGYVLNHAACLPDRLSSTLSPTNQYPAEYYFDYPRTAPLVRTIMISAGLTIESIAYRYTRGSPSYDWLSATIDGARASGVPWVVVGVHKACISAGQKTCEIGADLMNLLVEKKVDLVLQAHDHNYQRSKQLGLDASSCPAVPVAAYDPDCVVDDGTDAAYAKGAGTLFVIAGTFGRDLSAPSPFDAEAPYFARIDGTSWGFVRYTVTANRIDARFVNSGGAFTDAFTLEAGQSPQADISPPTTPQDLAATAASTRVDLLWSPSTDNAAVDHYAVFRDGLPLGTSTASSYADTLVLPATTYTYRVAAYDAAGNPSPLSAPLTVATPAQVGSLTFTPMADAVVRADKPGGNDGATAQVAVDGSPVKHALLRFDVSGTAGRTITRAVLRVHCVDPSGAGGDFHRVVDPALWSEASVTWDTAPAFDPAIVGSLGAVSAGTWYEVDVTPLVAGDGLVSVRVTSTSGNGADFTSKEGTTGFAPQLVVSLD